MPCKCAPNLWSLQFFLVYQLSHKNASQRLQWNEKMARLYLTSKSFVICGERCYCKIYLEFQVAHFLAKEASGKYLCTCRKVSFMTGGIQRQTRMEHCPNFSICAVGASTCTYKVSSKFRISPDKWNSIIYRHRGFQNWKSSKRSFSKAFHPSPHPLAMHT